MKTSRTSRLLTVIVAIFGMLFMQLAVASYACPTTSPGNQHHAASPSPMAAGMAKNMAHCDGMDSAPSTLCHAHAQGEPATQSPDKTAVPQVPPFVPVVLLSALRIVDLPALRVRQTHPLIALTRTAAPPIAIRNCCFRI